jgi:ABC-2 type transport system ATP-binding protein
VPVVALDRLSKRYGARLAVDGVSFEVARGEILGLLGPNGSGKTTVLRMLTGYLRPSAGTAEIAGFDVVRDGRAARGRVGYVPEDAPLYPDMRVDEFLFFMGRLRGLDGPQLERALALARERFALNSVRSTIIARLSRGYRQRVSLAQALLHDPDLLVLDEPTNGLDPRQIIEFRGHVRAAAERCAVIITSHILGEIERVADRAAILLDGRLLAVKPICSSALLRIRIRAEGAAQLRSVLASTGGIEEMIEDRAEAEEAAAWRVRLADRSAREGLVSALCAAGATIIEVGEIGSDLETTFLRLTAEQKRAA